VLHRVDGEDRFVVRERGEDRVAGDVLRQHHAAHAGQRQRRGSIHAREAAMRDGREDGGRVQRTAYLGDVVHVGGGTGHLCGGALVRLRAAARR
jgi:hypothetical protein